MPVLSTERMESIPEATCKCYLPPLHFSDFEIAFLGTDETKGRFADVSVETCRHCHTKWLKYAVEFEGFRNSGRWYRGIIQEADCTKMTPQKAVAYLEKLDWYIYGGSYFSSTGKYGKGHVRADV